MKVKFIGTREEFLIQTYGEFLMKNETCTEHACNFKTKKNGRYQKCTICQILDCLGNDHELTECGVDYMLKIFDSNGLEIFRGMYDSNILKFIQEADNC